MFLYRRQRGCNYWLTAVMWPGHYRDPGHQDRAKAPKNLTFTVD